MHCATTPMDNRILAYRTLATTQIGNEATTKDCILLQAKAKRNQKQETSGSQFILIITMIQTHSEVEE